MRLIMTGDAPRASTFVCGVLTRGGHVVDQVGSGCAALAASAAACDAVVFCPGRVDEALHQMIRKLRTARPQLAIFVVATAASSGEVCDLLEAGADDVVATPAGSALLLARLIAVVRRAADHAAPDIRVGVLVMRLRQRECIANGEPVALTEMEYRLLEALALRRGQPVPRSSLLELLYAADSEPFPKSIDLFVHNIRRKLTPVGCSRYLATRGKGFALGDGAAALAA